MPDFTIIDGVAHIESDALRASWWTSEEYMDAVVAGLSGGDVHAKQIVMRFEAALAQVMAAKNIGAELDAVLATHIATDYHQHDPRAGEGRPGLANWLRTVAVHFPGTPPPPAALVANGGIVSCLIEVRPPDRPASFIVTMFRVADGKLVEHWGGAS